jgi:hypothetical protein
MATLDFPPNPVPGQQFTALGLVWTWDGNKWTSTSNDITGIPDAPSDGQNYGRQFISSSSSMGWLPTSGGGGGIPEAPTGAGVAYARRNSSWSTVTHADITDWTANIPQVSTASPSMDGTATPGSSGFWADGAHVHPTDTSLAPKANPTFTGTVTIPAGASIAGYAPLASPAFLGVPTTFASPTAGDISTKLATTAFVSNAVGASAYTLPTASTTILGGVKVDGTTITATSGVISASAFLGTTTNNDAAPGYIGEYPTPTLASTALTTNVAKTVQSLSLTAGDWDVEGYISITYSTNGQDTSAGISLVNNTMPSAGFGVCEMTGSNVSSYQNTTGTRRVSIAVTTTVYLVAQCSFIGGTGTAQGEIRARRVR